MPKVVRFCDYERRSREPDAQPERDPAAATIFILPVIRIERTTAPRRIPITQASGRD